MRFNRGPSTLGCLDLRSLCCLFRRNGGCRACALYNTSVFGLQSLELNALLCIGSPGRKRGSDEVMKPFVYPRNHVLIRPPGNTSLEIISTCLARWRPWSSRHLVRSRQTSRHIPLTQSLGGLMVGRDIHESGSVQDTCRITLKVL